MAAIGGPIESVSIAGRIFAVAQDADSTRKLGGNENEIQMNGDGSGRTIKTRVAWMVSGLSLSIDDAADDHEFLQEVADGDASVPINITYASGETYGGVGIITGELTTSSANATGSVSLSGAGKLTRQ